MYLLSVFIHLICATFWIGGMLFIPLILVPGIKDQPNRVLLLYITGLKFRFYGWISIVLLFITGFFNLYLKGIPLNWNFMVTSAYGRLLTIKIILFITMLLIAAIHDFIYGKKSIEEMQHSMNKKYKLLARWTGMLNLALAIGIAYLGLALSRGIY